MKGAEPLEATSKAASNVKRNKCKSNQRIYLNSYEIWCEKIGVLRRWDVKLLNCKYILKICRYIILFTLPCLFKIEYEIN